MSQEMKFIDIKDESTFKDYVYQEAYIGNPDMFWHKDQWEKAESFVIDNLTEEQLRYLEDINII